MPLLVASCNPEEGNLPEQVVDRFALVVQTGLETDQWSPEHRADAVRRVEAFFDDPDTGKTNPYNPKP